MFTSAWLALEILRWGRTVPALNWMTLEHPCWTGISSRLEVWRAGFECSCTCRVPEVTTPHPVKEWERKTSSRGCLHVFMWNLFFSGKAYNLVADEKHKKACCWGRRLGSRRGLPPSARPSSLGKRVDCPGLWRVKSSGLDFHRGAPALTATESTNNSNDK